MSRDNERPRAVSAAAARPADGSDEMPVREVIARAIYGRQPFRVAQTGGVLDVMRTERVFEWEDAPSWYRSECWELADGVCAALMLKADGAARSPVRQTGGVRVEGHDAVHAALLETLGRWGSATNLAAEARTAVSAISEMKAGRRLIADRVAAALGFRKVLRYERTG